MDPVDDFLFRLYMFIILASPVIVIVWLLFDLFG